MIQLQADQVKNFFTYAIQYKIPYTATSTNARFVIKSGGTTYVTKNSKFPPHELFFIRMVKEQIIKNELFESAAVKKVKLEMKKGKITGKKIKYNRFSGNIKPNIDLGKCLEIDISSAYWQTAYQLGLIQETLYNRSLPMTWDQALEEKVITRQQYKKCVGMTPATSFELGIIDYNILSKVGGISKRTRLASIGSLARNKKIIRFTGLRWITLFNKRDQLAYLWDIIAYKVSQVMQEAANECSDGFILYWVDAIFIKPEYADKVKAVFTKHGYNFKQYKLEKIWTSDDQLLIKSKEKSKKVIKDGKEVMKDTRTFKLPMENKKIGRIR
jgi:hypothetical protein